MVATQTQLRRGTAAQCDGMTPAEAEPIVDLTNDRFRIGDGTTQGGIVIPNGYDIQQAAMNFAVAGGTANALTLTIYPVPSGYSQPMNIKFRASSTNTGATTIDVSGLGTRNIYKWSGGSLVALTSGDLRSGGIYEIYYDGTQFQLANAPVASIVSVGQGDLRTSTGTFSQVASNALATIYFNSSSPIALPGGQYGFMIETSQSFSDLLGGWWISNASFSYSSYATCWSTQSSGTVNGRQRYITSSPPYNLGDGETGGFIFLLLNESGSIVSHYAADTPPWAYNGPTDIRCTHKCPITGKKFRKAMKKKSFDEIMSGAKIEYEMQEITDEIKNADMALIPHPFGEVPPGHKVVMLDPMSEKTERLIILQNNGGSDEVTEAITKGYIKLDNSRIKRCGPKGVTPCKFRFKGESNG